MVCFAGDARDGAAGRGRGRAQGTRARAMRAVRFGSSRAVRAHW
jgi:hypothetical protein